MGSDESPRTRLRVSTGQGRHELHVSAAVKPAVRVDLGGRDDRAYGDSDRHVRPEYLDVWVAHVEQSPGEESGREWPGRWPSRHEQEEEQGDDRPFRKFFCDLVLRHGGRGSVRAGRRHVIPRMRNAMAYEYALIGPHLITQASKGLE